MLRQKLFKLLINLAMQQPIIYALDFDGVICDSAWETGMAGWKTAAQLWPEMQTQPTDNLLHKFRFARPILETGYEAVLIIYLLHQGVEPEEILASFVTEKPKLLQRLDLDITHLKNLFAATRDHWIAEHIEEWVALNPLFAGVKEQLQQWVATDSCYILTTKQERFVKLILAANDITLPAERIFGLDRNASKDQILLELSQKHLDSTLRFIEDRLPALISVQQHPELQGIELQLAAWGYNTSLDHKEARQHGIAVIELTEFNQLAAVK